MRVWDIDWEDNIKVGIKEIKYVDVDRTQMAQNWITGLMIMVMELLGPIKCREFLFHLIYYKDCLLHEFHFLQRLYSIIKTVFDRI